MTSQLTTKNETIPDNGEVKNEMDIHRDRDTQIKVII